MNLHSLDEVGTKLVGKTSSCCRESEASIIFGLFGEFERKAMAFLVERL